MTRSLSSSSGLKVSSIWSPSGPDTRRLIRGLEARRAVGSMVRLPSAAMLPALETHQNIGELAGNGFCIECENPDDNMVGACLVGRVEIARFGRWLERTHDHPRGVGTQIERLPVQEGGLQQGVLGSLESGG